MSFVATKSYNAADFDFWLKSGLNVLLIGKHGVGKTSLVLDTVKKHNLKYGFISGGTADPWTDLCGIPKEFHDKERNVDYLKFVKPELFATGEVEFLFIDELNRSHKKVQNALFEIIQFKSIHGTKFPNLKCVWAAINPHDDEEHTYHTEEMDTALLDRFHIRVELPYEPSLEYFTKKFQENGEVACKWWKNLSTEEQKIVSPRRLDYALEHYLRSGNLKQVFGDNINTASFVQQLSSGNPEKKLRRLIKDREEEELRKWLANKNNLLSVKKIIIEEQPIMSAVLHLIDLEDVSSWVTQHTNVKNEIIKNSHKYEDLIEQIANGSSNIAIKKQFQTILEQIKNNPANNANIQNIKDVSIRSPEALSDVNFLKEELPSLEKQIYVKRDVLNYQTTKSKASEEAINKEIVCLATDTFVAKNQYLLNSIYDKIQNLATIDSLNKDQGLALLRILNLVCSESGTRTLNSNAYENLPEVINALVSKSLNDLSERMSQEEAIKMLSAHADGILFVLFGEKNTGKFDTLREKVGLDVSSERPDYLPVCEDAISEDKISLKQKINTQDLEF